MDTATDDQTDRSALRWMVTLPALCLPLLASFFYFVWFPGTVLGNSFYIGVKVFMVIWPLIAIGLILREKFFKTNRTWQEVQARRFPASPDSDPPSQAGGRNHRLSLILGGIFGILTVGVLFGLMKFTSVGEMVYENADRIAQRITDLGIKNHYLLFALFISIVHAFLEEYYWRYFAFGQLKQLIPVGWAIAVAGIGFAAHHIVVMTQFVDLGPAIVLGSLVGVGGAIWSIIYHRSNSLLGAWFSHMLIDFGIMWVGWEVMQSTLG